MTAERRRRPAPKRKAKPAAEAAGTRKAVRRTRPRREKPPARTAASRSRPKGGATLALPAIAVPADLRRLRDDLRGLARPLLVEVERRQKLVEREAARLVRGLVRQFRSSLHSSMVDLQRRVARLEKRAAELERRLG